VKGECLRKEGESVLEKIKLSFCSELEKKEELKEEGIMAEDNEKWWIDDELWHMFQKPSHNFNVLPTMSEVVMEAPLTMPKVVVEAPPMMPEVTVKAFHMMPKVTVKSPSMISEVVVEAPPMYLLIFYSHLLYCLHHLQFPLLIFE